MGQVSHFVSFGNPGGVVPRLAPHTLYAKVAGLASPGQRATGSKKRRRPSPPKLLEGWGFKRKLSRVQLDKGFRRKQLCALTLLFTADRQVLQFNPIAPQVTEWVRKAISA